MNAVPLKEISGYLDNYLRIGEIPDEPNALNGLQVENRGMVSRLVAAVDASQGTIDGVPAGDSPLLLVHHGLFWDGNVPVTGRRYRRLRTLLAHDIALYSAHIPLDLHSQVGNNVCLAARLGITIDGWFGRYRGVTIGVHGRVPAALAHRSALTSALAEALSIPASSIHLVPGGPEMISRLGIITGAAGNMIAAVRDEELDTFVTGEGSHHTHFDAMEWGVNLIYAGHYATESLGIQALTAHLAERFGLPWEFHDHPTGL